MLVEPHQNEWSCWLGFLGCCCSSSSQSCLLVPAVISASRAIGDSILLSKLGIESLSDSDGYKALAHGVDLSVAENFLDDFTPLGYALINQELTIIKILSGCMLVGGWLAGGGANGFVSWLSNSSKRTSLKPPGNRYVKQLAMM